MAVDAKAAVPVTTAVHPLDVSSASRPNVWVALAVMALAIGAAVAYLRRVQNVNAVRRGGMEIEDRRLAGRCLCELEELLARPAPPSLAAELSQLHRLGLGLRYGVEFSREPVRQLQTDARRIRRAMDAFERSLARGAKKRA